MIVKFGRTIGVSQVGGIGIGIGVGVGVIGVGVSLVDWWITFVWIASREFLGAETKVEQADQLLQSLILTKSLKDNSLDLK